MPGTAPTNCDFTVTSPYGGILTWQNNDEYHYIEVWENRESAGYVLKDTIQGFKESRVIGGLDPDGINYCYKVLGGWWEPPGETAFSNEDCEDTYYLLQAPTGIATTLFSDFVEITWVDNSSAEDVFCIERKLGAGAFSEIATVSANVEYYRDTTVVAGSSYTYQVRARENPSNYSGYTTGTQVTANNAPNVPTGATISEVTDEEMRVTWVAPAAGFAVTGYKVQISDTGVFGGEEAEHIVDVDVLSLFFKGLTPSQQYWIRVYSYNGVGDSASYSADNDTCLAARVRTKFELFVRDPNIEPVYIAGMDLKMDLSGFTLTGGQTYTYEIVVDERGLTFDYVWEDGSLLTERTSIATVEANAGSWWWDASVKKLYVHAKNGTDPDNFFMEGGFTHLIPNRNFTYADTLCTLPSWLSAQSIPQVTQENKPYFAGSFRLSTGSISLINALSKGEYYFDKRFEKFTWIGSRLTLYCGKDSFSALTDFKKMFSAYISDKSIDDRKITFSLRDSRKELERDLVLNKYWITDYPDMEEDFDGREKPKAYGYVEDVAPVPIKGYDVTTHESAKFSYHDGRSKTVGKVMVNDVEKAKDTDYYCDLQRSIIVFDKSVDVGEDDIVLVSFTGQVNTADVVVENGAEIFKHIMNNEAKILTTKLNTDWIYEARDANTKSLSILFYKDTPYDEILRTLEHTTEAYILQDGDARLGLRPLQTTVPSKAKYIWNFQGKGHKHSKDRDSLYYKAKVYYGEDPQSQEWEVKEATDDDIKSKFGVERELPIYCYFRDPSNAQALVTTILGLLNKVYIEEELPAILFDAFPGDLIKFSRTRFFDTSGTASEVTMRILKVEKKPQSGMTGIKMEKV